MERSEIIEILQYWNFWKDERQTGVERNSYVDELYRQSGLKEVSIVTGVRRSGKSTIMLQVLKRLIDSGTNKKNTLYINLEEPAFAGDLNLKFLLKIYDTYLESFNPKGKIYIFLDEIHLVPGWERFVRGLYDRNENIKFYITGSSSRLLSKEYGMSLTGRIYSNEIFPLDFKEFLLFKNVRDGFDGLTGKGSPALRNQFMEFMEYGGFPQIVLTTDKKDKSLLLKEYYSAIIEKDIAQRNSIKDIRKLKDFCINVITNISTTYSGYRAAKKQEISQPTANKYLEYLKETYLVLKINYFDYSFIRQKAHPYKIYSIDPGLYNAVSFKFSKNSGRVFENIIFLTLRKNGLEIFYWKDKKGREVDFMIRQGGEIINLINACWELNSDNEKRETDTLLSAMKRYDLDEAMIITSGYSKSIEIENKKIIVKNIFELLSKQCD
ncbi:MAG TPA: hypothetical protein DCP02_02505 [Actinobacteria bacterium]|nr:hypothetical protein [Actinomycetota bacterium]